MATPQQPGEVKSGDPAREDLAFEIRFYEDILERVPDMIDVLMALGNDYTQGGHYEQGLAIDQRLCELRVRDPYVRYNLACSCSLVGRVDEALEALEMALTFGYDDFEHMQRDPDLESLRADLRYLAILERVTPQQSPN